MFNTFKLCPTHFSREGKICSGEDPLAGADWAFKSAGAFSLRRPWPMQRRTTEGHYG